MRSVWPCIGAISLVASSCLGLAIADGRGAAGTPTAAAALASADRPALPEGWRWEAFRDVEVGVPNTWGWDLHTGVDNPCSSGDAPARRTVMRPSRTIPAMGCIRTKPEEPTNRSKLVKYTGRFVAFAEPSPVEGPPTPGRTTIGDRTTVVGEHAVVSIQADRAVREQILSTLHTITTDARGCTATSVLSRRPSARPKPAIDVTELIDVRRVSACLYELPGAGRTITGPTLRGSLQLTGRSANRLIAAAAAAPRGAGPDSCPDSRRDFGVEAVVLQVTTGKGRSQLYVRYSGCTRNGVDDGVHVRRLTRGVVQPIIAGPNRPSLYYGGPEKSKIIQP